MTTLLSKLAKGWPVSPGVKPSIPLAVNWSDSITRGLVALGMSNELFQHDLVTGAALEYYNNTPSLRTDEQGNTLHFNETRNGEAILLKHIGPDWLYLRRNFTYACRMKFHGNTTSNVEHTVFGHYTDLQGSTTNARLLYRYQADVDNFDIRYNKTSASQVTMGPSVSIEDGRYHDFVLVSDDTHLRFYLDGIEKGNVAHSGATMGDVAAASTYVEVMGGHAVTNATEDSPQFDLTYFGLWDRHLTPNETAELSRGRYVRLVTPANQSPFMVGVTIPDATGIPVLSLPVYSNVNETDADVGCTVTF